MIILRDSRLITFMNFENERVEKHVMQIPLGKKTISIVLISDNIDFNVTSMFKD